METRIFNISDDLEDVLSKSADILKKGGLVAFPTETVYGLGANPFNLKAVYKIYHVKGRPKDNPLIFHISSIDWLGRLAFFSEREKGLIEKFFPGPLTLVFKSRIKSIYTFGLNTIAVRMPDNFIALKLIDRFGLPIVA
ncbi:MAG: L-threonylcarbamoyladenylate synthase, partial [Proteobacteria bacterium]|nr:L-threonylcarbamoyladenylate synthase [Pseudomonadota bacterium]